MVEKLAPSVSIRPLGEGDSQAFREMRLLALRTTAGVYTGSYQAECEREDGWWRDLMAGADHQAFGLFDGQTMVAITAVFTDRNDPSRRTALLAMSFILPEYRGRGWSELLCGARLEWARNKGMFTRVVVSHRASNEASRRANQRHGFRPTGRTSHVWPDGSVDDEVFYELAL